jgi:hypothetical protein
MLPNSRFVLPQSDIEPEIALKSCADSREEHRQDASSPKDAGPLEVSIFGQLLREATLVQALHTLPLLVASNLPLARFCSLEPNLVDPIHASQAHHRLLWAPSIVDLSQTRRAGPRK